MDHQMTVYEKKRVELDDRCKAPACTRRAQFRVTVSGKTRELCDDHTGESLRTALTFLLGHTSVRLGFEDEFREWT